MLTQKTPTNVFEDEDQWNATSIIEGAIKTYYPTRLDELIFLNRFTDKSYPRINEIIGFLVGITSGVRRTFCIDTSKGLIDGKYSIEMESDIKKSYGFLVRLKNVKDIMSSTEIDDISKIQRIKKLPIESFFVGNKNIRFKKPLQCDFIFENGRYNVSNDRYSILVVSDNMREVIIDIKDQLNLLWREYVECDESELTDNAIKFRNLLIRSVI